MNTLGYSECEASYNRKLAEYISRLSTAAETPPIAAHGYVRTPQALLGGERSLMKNAVTFYSNLLSLDGGGRPVMDDGGSRRQATFQQLPNLKSATAQVAIYAEATHRSSCGGYTNSHNNGSSCNNLGGVSSNSNDSLGSAFSGALGTSANNSASVASHGNSCCCPMNQSDASGCLSDKALLRQNTSSISRQAPRPAGARPSLPLLFLEEHLPLDFEALMEADMDDLLARNLIHWTPEQLVEDALERTLNSARSGASAVPLEPAAMEPIVEPSTDRAEGAAKTPEDTPGSLHGYQVHSRRKLGKILLGAVFGDCTGRGVRKL